MPEAEKVEISVIIVNFNGQRWIERCLRSLEEQTISDNLEILVTDNGSTDGSDQVAVKCLSQRRRSQVLLNRENLGFSQANNLAADVAKGEFLFFLNNDTWLERDCLERLWSGARVLKAEAVAPTILDYESNEFQGIGAAGLDPFGLPNGMGPTSDITEIFAGGGCSLLVRADVFRQVGGFASELFMYAEETDLCWRLWLAGGRIVVIPHARVHHRGAAAANPKGEARILEFRTTETKRFYTNRNGILLLLKNSQHILLLLLFPHVLLLALEGLVGLLLVRRWGYVRKCYLSALTDCWRLRGHVRGWRTRIRTFRRRSDFWMLRFLHWQPNRWPEIKRIFKFGFPKVDAR